MLHIIVDFRSPETRAGSWHRIMTVTKSWFEARAKETQSGIFPALLIVPDGDRPAIEASITEQLGGSWRLLTNYATVAPANYPDAEGFGAV